MNNKDTILRNCTKSLLRDLDETNQKLRSVNTLLHPLLNVLEEEDVPVSSCGWATYCAGNIYLEPEVKLTRTAFRRILFLLRHQHPGEKILIRREVSNGYVIFSFRLKEKFSTLLIISNGSGTCKVERTDKAALRFPQYDYTPANGCPGLELR